MSKKDETLMEDNTFTMTDENGTVYECEILLTFDCEEGVIVVFTDGSLDDDGCTRVFASKLGEPKPGGDATLLPIENDETWNAVDAALSELFGKE